MKWPPWLKLRDRHKPASPPSLTSCPKCGAKMIMVEKFTMMGDDRRTYRCTHCGDEHIVIFGTAMWKLMSDANKLDSGT